MATQIQWLGGASRTAQVDDFTPANVEIDDIFILTATGEDGVTAAVSFTATAATVANVTAGLTALWNASTDALHTGITAADNSSKVTLTADDAGVPFHVTASTTDGGGTDDQTLTKASATANSGPNDYATTANWEGGSLPADNEEAIFNDGYHSVLYSLDQSASGVNLAALRKGPNYYGNIGQPGNPNAKLKIDVDGTGDQQITINGNLGVVMIQGTIPTVHIINTGSGANAVRLGGTIDKIHAFGTGVLGNIHVEDATDLDMFYCFGAPSAKVFLGASLVSFTDLHMDSGTFEIKTPPAVLDMTGGRAELLNDLPGGSPQYHCRGGTMLLDCGGTMFKLNVHGGLATTDGNRSDGLTITDADVRGGTYRNQGGMKNVTHTNNIKRYGGTVASETGGVDDFTS